jgi:hypothetical protein
MSRHLAAPAVSRCPVIVKIFLIALAFALLSTLLVAAVPPLILIVGLSISALVVGVAVHPPLAAYVLLFTTPLIAGINRGTIIPLLRPHEAIALLVATGLLARSVIRGLAGRVRRPRIRAIDATIVLMAISSSVLPLLWMIARGLSPSSDDVLSALTLWKYYALYLIMYRSVDTKKQVERCLWLSLAAAGIVAVVAILQSLTLLGVPDLLAHYYAPEEGGELLRDFRGTSTLSSSIAVGDVLTFSLAIALGWLARGGRRRLILVSAAILFVFGIISSGQFSGVIALLLGLFIVGLLTGSLGRLALALLGSVPVAGFVLKPVIDRRLSGFSSLEGLPHSWVIRLQNLRTFFWSRIFSDFNYLLGVRPKAWVIAPERGLVWIESGYTWLLWTGGIPFFASFFVFLWFSLRTTFRIARERADVIGVTAIASFTSIVVMAFLMTFDVHMTIRGSADLLFSLLGLAYGFSERQLPSIALDEESSTTS